ncbi:fusaric acid resistance family protein [Kitasatospora cineracea]|uniref:Fusaric acid resistance family protein n=2 Tax=Kitasatospora cineracea TaxID=88074 RepID=A0A8G1X7U2_9ACTN|nr:fusaric acid resistance family protein [Kitasatospora cineracea]
MVGAARVLSPRGALALSGADGALLFAVRAALAMALPAVPLVLAGHPRLSVYAMLGSFTTTFGRGLPYRRRARVLALVALAMTAAVGAGSLLAARVGPDGGRGGAAAVVAATALVAGAAKFGCDAARLSGLGAVLLLFSFAVAANGAPTGPEAAAQTAAAALGAAVAWALSVSGRLWHPDRPQRLAAAAALRAVADLLERAPGPARSRARHRATGAVLRAYGTLETHPPTRSDQGGRGGPCLQLTDLCWSLLVRSAGNHPENPAAPAHPATPPVLANPADRAAPVGPADHAAPAASADPDDPSAPADPAARATTTDSAAQAHPATPATSPPPGAPANSGHPAVPAGSAGRAAPVGSATPAVSADLPVRLRAQARLLADGSLRSTVLLADLAAPAGRPPDGSGRDGGGSPSRPGPVGRRTAELLAGPGSRRHRAAVHAVPALRMALGTGVAGGLALLLGLGHGYWAALTAAAVLHSVSLRTTTHRAVQRTLGTLAGLAVAVAVLAAGPGPGLLVAVIVLLEFLLEYAVVRNYALGVLFVTPLALLMSDLASPASAEDLVLDRALGSVLGIAVGLLCALLVVHDRAAVRVERALAACTAAAGRAERALAADRFGPAPDDGAEARPDVRTELAQAVVELREADDAAAGELWETGVDPAELAAAEERAYLLLGRLHGSGHRPGRPDRP